MLYFFGRDFQRFLCSNVTFGLDKHPLLPFDNRARCLLSAGHFSMCCAKTLMSKLHKLFCYLLRLYSGMACSLVGYSTKFSRAFLWISNLQFSLAVDVFFLCFAILLLQNHSQSIKKLFDSRFGFVTQVRSHGRPLLPKFQYKFRYVFDFFFCCIVKFSNPCHSSSFLHWIL